MAMAVEAMMEKQESLKSPSHSLGRNNSQFSFLSIFAYTFTNLPTSQFFLYLYLAYISFV